MKPNCSVCAVYYENAPGNTKECGNCGSLSCRLNETLRPKAKSTAVKDAKARRDAAKAKSSVWGDGITVMIRENYKKRALNADRCANCLFGPIASLKGRDCEVCTPLSDNAGFLAS